MRTKYAIIVAAVLVITAAAGLWQYSSMQEPEPKYPLPVRVQDIETLFAEKDLDWKLSEVQSFREGNRNISFKNDINVFCVIDTNKFYNGGKYVRIFFRFGSNRFDDIVDKVNDFNGEYMRDLVDLVGELYGRPKEMRRVYREMQGEIDECVAIEGKRYWTKRTGDNHYNMNVEIVENENGRAYMLYDIVVKNTDANEIMIASQESAYKSQYSSFDLTYGTVQDVAATEPHTVDISVEKIKAIAITGNITNLRKKDGLTYADLNDSTGSTTVIIRPSTTLNAEEFKEVRRHYITFDHDIAPVGMVTLSVLPSVKLPSD